MPSLRKDYGVDKEKAQNGVWQELGGIRLLIAHIGNQQYRNKIESLTSGKRGKIRRGTAQLSEYESINRRAVAETVLLDWENLQDDNGKDIPYSIQKVVQLFDEFPQFYEDVMELASNLRFYQEEEEAAAKEQLGND